MNKSWVQELHEEFNFYDYKGKKVIGYICGGHEPR